MTGPFDIIGDVHGCRSELQALLRELGWTLEPDGGGAHHPEAGSRCSSATSSTADPTPPRGAAPGDGHGGGRNRAVRLGQSRTEACPGLHGRKVATSHGLQQSLDQLAAESDDFRRSAHTFIDGLISHYELDGGNLVVAHAGLKQAYHGRASARVRSFALYGDTTGETDEYGLPVRYPWAHEYRGRAMIVYGHTPVPETEWINNTICLDTGVVFGGRLTALRYPSKDIVSVPAEQVWFEPVRPLGTGSAAPAHPGAARSDPVVHRRRGRNTAHRGPVHQGAHEGCARRTPPPRSRS